MTALAFKISVSSMIVNPRMSLLINQPLQSLPKGLFGGVCVCVLNFLYKSVVKEVNVSYMFIILDLNC